MHPRPNGHNEEFSVCAVNHENAAKEADRVADKCQIASHMNAGWKCNRLHAELQIITFTS